MKGRQITSILFLGANYIETNAVDERYTDQILIQLCHEHSTWMDGRNKASGHHFSDLQMVNRKQLQFYSIACDTILAPR